MKIRTIIDNPTIDNKYFIGYYFMKVFNRTSKNIENFFGDKEIELLAQMIGESYNYINSNTYLWLDGCIQAFDELKSDPDFFRQASKESDYDKYRDLVSSKYSEKVTKIIDFSSEYDTDDKLFKIYSFWVRRYNEGNADVVFTILKKIKNQLPSKTETDNLDFEKNTIESKILNDNFTAFDFNEEALNLLISKMDVRENYFERFIAENSIFIPRIDVSDREFFSDRYSTKLMGKLNEAYSDFDRSPENIKIIFNESLINHIAFLFNNGLLPKDQRIYDVLKGLLLTYDEMQDDECLRLFQIIKKYEYEYENMRNEFDKKCSDKVREFVFDGGDFKSSIKNDSDIDFGFSKRIFYLYSFWARRYKEGNKETVYKILKEIDEKIK